ncbi:hypothetical protein RhiJN_18319 [Ceratobasidium sp. AG-Ba]|nr:hypothetical protein RhiJN_18319 [Ceratobasidium sp. AG-Ba]
MPLASNYAFELQELVECIFRWMDKDDQHVLALLNRHIFYMIMPLLWKHVTLGKLFSLSPVLGDICNRRSYSSLGRSKDNRFYRSLKPLDNEDLTRFDVYAPWVKHMELGNGRIDYAFHKAIALLYTCYTRRVLLPNLISISSTALTNPLWVIPFLSPSLLRLSISIPAPEYLPTMIHLPSLSIFHSKILLHLLQQRCHQIEHLCLNSKEIVSDYKRRKDQEYHYVLPMLARHVDASIPKTVKRLLGYFISSMRPLASFTISSDMLNATCWETVSNWPTLESFEVIFTNRAFAFEIPRVSESAFPAISRLGVYGIPEQTVLRRFWDIPSLVSKLRTVKLYLPSTFFNRESDAAAVLMTMFDLIARHSPDIQSLWIATISPLSQFRDEVTYKVSTGALGKLEKLPLRKLRLDGMIIHPATQLPEYIASTFPELIELGLPSQRILLTELGDFSARLPHLELLHIEPLTQIAWSNNTVELEKIPRHRARPLHTLEANFMTWDADGNYYSEISMMQYREANAFLL